MEFNQSVITNKGRTLMAKLLSGKTTAQFTKIVTSSSSYQAGQLEGLTSISNIKQTSTVEAKPNNGATVTVEGAFDNAGLAAGYDVNTIGLYATDPDEGEILYAVATAKTKGFMPADNGVSNTGLVVKFYTEVGNASQVNMMVDSSAFATKGDIRDLRGDVQDLQGFVGYNDEDIFGTEVDMVNKTFKRLAGSINRIGGEGFNDIKAFGGRKRCIITDAGEVVAYYGETGYTESGTLTAAVTRGEKTYPEKTLVQVMVEQPLFYYRVVPIEIEPIADGKGYHMRRGRYYVSDKPKAGFKIHPAFIVNGEVKDKVYLAAYEGCLYDPVSPEGYRHLDQAYSDLTGLKFSSIAGAKPASGLTTNLTRANVRTMAQRRGSGWNQAYAATVAATQLLFLIEYNTFNWQDVLGMGPTQKTDDGATNMSDPTGATSILGNKSGQVKNADGISVTSYRGEENFFGNIWAFVDGMNGRGSGLGYWYIADHDFAESKSDGAYKDCGFSVAKANGYTSAFGFSYGFDWLFLPSETKGNSSVPVGDYYSQNVNGTGWYLARRGGRWNSGGSAGGFYWYLVSGSGYRSRNIGGRLVYA